VRKDIRRLEICIFLKQLLFFVFLNHINNIVTEISKVLMVSNSMQQNISLDTFTIISLHTFEHFPKSVQHNISL